MRHNYINQMQREILGDELPKRATNLYQVCTCSIQQAVCPIHGFPPQSTFTSSNTELSPQGREEENKRNVEEYQAYLNNKLVEAEEIIVKLEHTRDVQITEIAQLRNLVAHHEAVIAERNSAIEQLDRDVERLEGELQRAGEEINLLEKQNKNLIDELKDIERGNPD